MGKRIISFRLERSANELIESKTKNKSSFLRGRGGQKRERRTENRIKMRGFLLHSPTLPVAFSYG